MYIPPAKACTQCEIIKVKCTYNNASMYKLLCNWPALGCSISSWISKCTFMSSERSMEICVYTNKRIQHDYMYTIFMHFIYIHLYT